MRTLGAFAAIALLALAAAPPASPQSAPPPSPLDGRYGVTLTVAQLLELQRNAPPSPPRTPRRHTRPGTSTSTKLQPSVPSKSTGILPPRIPQTVGTSFTGDSADAATVVTPPDCMGAVGPSQFVVITNHFISVYKKTGAPDTFSIDVNVFFSRVLPVGSSMSDPRIRYDRLSQRWFITALEDNGIGGINNRIYIAVSDGPVIGTSSSFTFFFFEEDLAAPQGDSNAFADYDTLGVDANALYIGVNVFGATFSTTGFVVQKSSVLGAGPMQVTAFRNLIAADGSGIYTPQGVDNDDPAATEGYFIGTNNASSSNVVNLIIKRILNPGSTTPSMSADLSVSIPTASFLGEGVASPLNFLWIDDLDLRLYMATVKNVGGSTALWTTHNVQTNSGATDAVAWYKIGNLTTTPSLVDSGLIQGTSAGESCWMPSLAVTGQGHMVIGYNFTGPSPSDHIGARVTSHLATDGPGVT